jgi:hypothetical protein
MKEIDDITFLSHCIKLGIIETGQVSSWADRQISANQQPPYWMIQLSTETGDDPNAIQSVLFDAGAAAQVDDDAFLALVAGFYSCTNDSHRAFSLLWARFCVEFEELTDLQRELFSIDEVDSWDKPEAIKKLDRLLKNYVDDFTKQADRIGLLIHGAYAEYRARSWLTLA